MAFPGRGAEMPAVTQRENAAGNLQCLFYATGSGGATDSIVSSNRVANAWIASLRTGQRRQSPLSAGSLPNVRYYHDPELFGAPMNSSQMSGKRRESVESSVQLEQNSEEHRRRMRQLALQTANKMRSLVARESTATAERWRYIQSALERRRRDLIENRERFIRQPLETVVESVTRKSILKRSASTPGRPTSAYWARHWLTSARKNVRFQFEEDVDEDFPLLHEENLDVEMRYRLPSLQTPDEMADANRTPPDASPKSNGEHLPPLPDRVNSNGCSWAERQVAKVRQRRLWSGSNAGRDTKRPLLRSESLLVNLSSASEDDEQPEDEQRPDRRRSVTWDIDVERNKCTPDDSSREVVEERRAYSGWHRFPRLTASRIRERSENLKKTPANERRDAESASALLARRRQFSDKMRRRLADARRKRRSASSADGAERRRQTMEQRNEIPDEEPDDGAEVASFSRLRKISETSETDEDVLEQIPVEECTSQSAAAKVIEDQLLNDADANGKLEVPADKVTSTKEVSKSEEQLDSNEKEEGTQLTEKVIEELDAQNESANNKLEEQLTPERVLLEDEVMREDNVINNCPQEDEQETDTLEECCVTERTPSSASTCSPDASSTRQQQMDKRTKDAWNSLKMTRSPGSSGVASYATNPSCDGYSDKLTPAPFDRLGTPDDDAGRAMNETQRRDGDAVRRNDEPCRCVHEAVLACLVPEAAGALHSLDAIRRQLRRARLRQSRKAEPLRPGHGP